MTTPDPYSSPQTAPQRDPPSGYIRIWNVSHASGVYGMAFVVEPAILGVVVLSLWRAQDWAPLAFAAFIWGSITTASFIYALFVPTIWVEFGPTLRFRTLARLHEHDWQDVSRIWFDREFSGLTTYRALAIAIGDRKAMEIHVPESMFNLLNAELRRHPCFRELPYDPPQCIPGEEPDEWYDEERDGWYDEKRDGWNER